MNNPAKLNRNKRYYQGVYKPKNKKKYLGDLNKCIYRSLWERIVFVRLDDNPNVLGWQCEPFPIGYISPKDNRPHRYFPDILVVANSNGEQVTTLIEIKPFKETVEPKLQGKKRSRQLYEAMTYSINQAKWAAAEAFCKKKGWRFRLMTEKEINPQAQKK